MKITPQDIHHKEFKRTLRGYNEEEVDVFLDQIADQFEKLYKRNHTLEDELHQIKEKMKTYQNMELTLQNTLLTAQKSAEEVQMNAKKEADLVINNAKLEARNTLSGIEKQKQVLGETITKLKSLESDFKSKIRDNLDSFTGRLAKIDADENQVLQEIEKEFESLPEIEIPKVEKPEVAKPSTPQKDEAVAQVVKSQKKEAVKVAASTTQAEAKADASKSDIASEAEIDKFLQQEHVEPQDTNDVEDKKSSFFGRIFRRGEPASDNGEKVKVKASQVKKKKPKAQKSKKNKKKNTEEIE